MDTTKIERGKDIEALSNGQLNDLLIQDEAGLERLLKDIEQLEDPERWDGLL